MTQHGRPAARSAPRDFGTAGSHRRPRIQRVIARPRSRHTLAAFASSGPSGPDPTRTPGGAASPSRGEQPCTPPQRLRFRRHLRTRHPRSPRRRRSVPAGTVATGRPEPAPAPRRAARRPAEKGGEQRGTAAALARCRRTREGARAMILLIDNYDSFTFNLYHFLGDLGAEVEVRRNDAITVAGRAGDAAGGDRALARPLHAERGRHLPAADRRRRRRAGAAARRLPRPPGDRAGLRRRGGAGAGAGAWQGLGGPPPRHRRLRRPARPVPAPRATTRSWCAARTCPPSWRPPPGRRTGWSWAWRIATLPIWGVQFHPESIASQHGHDLLRNFLSLAGASAAGRAAAAAPA